MTDGLTTAPEQPERLDLRSEDIAADKREELLRLFPEARTEDGQVDFAQLQRVLGEVIDPGKERYGLTWPGKADCFRTIQSPSLGTLLPSKVESVNWDTTENLIIEGDNLEVLKLLQKPYLGKVKMIYIDPPYNTGNDFIYPDDYAESLKTYLEYTGQADEAGRRFSTNTDTDGRFHSKWLNMMYPRLYLARNLLRDDGVIFVSIDDGEVRNLRAICDDVFGETNFIGTAVWEKAYTANMTARHISNTHDYVVIYGRDGDRASLGRFGRTDEAKGKFRNADHDPRGPWKAENLSAGKYYGAGQFVITGPAGTEFRPPPGRYWRCNESQYRNWLEDDRITFGRGGTGRPMLKKFLSEVREGLTPSTWWDHDGFGTNKDASIELKRLLDGTAVPLTPKPVKLLRRMLELGTRAAPDIVLDFFAGSGTTGHAVLDLNNQDGGNRKFVLVQLPEATDRDDFPTIADITKERVRRVIAKLNADDPDGATTQDRGFRVFKLAESNISAWNGGIAHDEAALAKQLELHIDHVRDDRSTDDVLYEILLKSGFLLSTRVESIEIEETAVTSVAEGALLICLDQAISLELVRAVAARKPERAVFLDEGFAGNDALKANAAQAFKAAGVTFRTV